MADQARAAWGCIEEGCTEDPRTGGGPIFRLSPKGRPFIGACAKHFAKHDAPVDIGDEPMTPELEAWVRDRRRKDTYG